MQLVVGQGGLPKLVIRTPQADAEIYLHGAQVTHFQPRGQKPVLFLSGKSSFEPGKPIRGGVPICFPWFGARQDAPAHGFARLREWELVCAEPGAVTLQLVEDDWGATFRVSVGASLGMELTVKNLCREARQFEAALHTYLAVSDVRQVGITGLAGTTYLNTVGEPRENVEGTAPIRITAETDRLYLNTISTVTVEDHGWQRRIVIEKAGSHSTVVWNPWIAKAQRMADFGDDEWPGMLCVETCNVKNNAVTLATGAIHTMSAVIRPC